MLLPQTLGDVIKLRKIQSDNERIRWDREDSKKIPFSIPDNLHPAIGVLMTSKGVKFYAFVSGSYTEGSAEELNKRLCESQSWW